MATIETGRPHSDTSVRTPAYDRDESKLSRDETKLSFKTTEFYAMAGVIVAVRSSGSR